MPININSQNPNSVSGAYQSDTNGLAQAEMVRNFDFLKNSYSEITSIHSATLTMKIDGKEFPLRFLPDRDGNLQVRNGAVYNALIASEVIEKHSGDKISNFGASIKDGALSFGANRFRIAIGEDTATQKILENLRHIADPAERKVELSKLINGSGTPGQGEGARLKMANDPVRRAFESYYAKHALEDYFGSPEKCEKFNAISNDQVNYIRENFVAEDLFKKYEAAWKNESFDAEIVGLDQLQGFYGRAKATLETLNISNDARNILFDIYKHRYLDYALKNEPSVEAKLPNGHWDGIFDPIKAPGKGRIELNVKEGNLFRQADSHNVGIMRNIDPTPRDLRLNDRYDIKYEKDYGNSLLASASTRCPDRLEMQNPDHPDSIKPGSYMNNLFEKGTGTYVNGPSGSILIEHGAIRACKDVHANTSPDDIERFLEIQALLFIYVDGGHSMDEISYALKSGNSQSKFKEAFGNRDGFDAIGGKLFSNFEALDSAAKDAAIFNDALKAKDSLHADLKYSNPEAAIKSRELSLKQSVDARNVLYNPGDALVHELGRAADTLHRVILNLDPENREELCAHLFADGRLMHGKATTDVMAALQRVAGRIDTSSAGATDRAVVISLMGDIGGFYTTPKNASPELLNDLNEQLSKLGLHVPSDKDIHLMRESGGSMAVGPNKRSERKIRAYESRSDIPFRAGVHNQGEEADEKLNVAPKNRIPHNRWVVFDISTPRVKETEEPLVGHMSASPFEILQTWDMLAGVKGEDQCMKMLAMQSSGNLLAPMSHLSPEERAKHYARAAGAGAFLVGLGYHSAVEVLEGLLMYTGQSIRGTGVLSSGQSDSADLFGGGAATDLVSELFRASSKTSDSAAAI
ncbi:hypothetical protein [Burkholderia contaminans]|uniref:hypothetical protein n=1 Tax=Burkholderia contaminans TaxID=488447 RepID=UPI000B0F72C3|nr:hypothetical protein [Burkholderia contaminans]